MNHVTQYRKDLKPDASVNQPEPELYGDWGAAMLPLWKYNSEACRMVMIGDSQETMSSSGDGLLFQLNQFTAQKFGTASESPFIPPSNFSTTPKPNFLFGSASFGGSSISGNITLPSYVHYRSGATFGTVHQLNPQNQRSEFYAANDQRDYFPAGDDLAYEAFARSSTAGPPEISVQYRTHSADENPNFNHTLVATHVSGGLGLNLTDNEISSFITPAMPFNAAEPFRKVIVGGHDGTSRVANGIFAGGRWKRLNANRGITWQSFSFGGYRASSFLANHSLSGPSLKAIGPTVLVLSFGANDSGDFPAATYKANLITLINTLRGNTFIDSNIPVIINMDVLRYGTALQRQNQLDHLTVSKEIADELSGVCVYNPRPVMGFLDWDANRSLFIPDNLHPETAGQNVLAKSFIDTLAKYLPATDYPFRLQ